MQEISKKDFNIKNAQSFLSILIFNFVFQRLRRKNCSYNNKSIITVKKMFELSDYAVSQMLELSNYILQSFKKFRLCI